MLIVDAISKSKTVSQMAVVSLFLECDSIQCHCSTGKGHSGSFGDDCTRASFGFSWVPFSVYRSNCEIRPNHHPVMILYYIPSSFQLDDF